MSTPTDLEPKLAEGGAAEPKVSKFPSAFSVLGIVLLVMWVLTFIVPAGAYKLTEDGNPIPSSFHHVDRTMGFTERLKDLFWAPINGIMGVKNAEGVVSPYESGELYGSVGVFIFVMCFGIFITVCMKTGAIDAGISVAAFRMSKKGSVLIIILMVIFSIMGTTEGAAEETLGFYALVVPLMLSLGYDRMTAAATIMLGAGVGTYTSTVNPFATGVASGAAGVHIGDGIGLRFVMWIVFTIVAILYVLRYARKVHNQPQNSMVGVSESDLQLAQRGFEKPEKLSLRYKLVLITILFTFIFMIFSIVPWGAIIQGEDFSWELGWYFPELAAWFLLMAILVGVFAGFGEKGTVDTIIQGAADFIAPCLIIVFARGVTAVMNNGEITATILNALENLLQGVPAALFTIILYLVNIPLAFLVPSSSGHATLVMPIFGPLAQLLGVKVEMSVTAFQSASGWMNLITPTSAVVMGGLALAKVGYDAWLKFIWKMLLILLVLTFIFLGIGSVL